MLDEYKRDMERRGLLPRSIYRMLTHVRCFDRWLAERGRFLIDASTHDVQRFLDDREPITPRTRYTYLSSLHGFYGWAIREGRTEHDPTATIVRPKLRRTLPRPITDGDLEMALRMAPVDLRAWLVLMAYAGLRCAEVAGLRAEDVMWDQRLLRVIGKGRHERLVPMHEAVVDALTVYRVPRSGAVFRRPHGGPWGPAHVSRRVSAYFADLGIEATAHQLRHWFGSRTYAACRDLRVVQELLGHQSPTTTAVYTAFSHTEAAAAVAALTVSA